MIPEDTEAEADEVVDLEEGTTTTPFDMVMMNNLDRFHLVMDVIDRVPSLGSHAAALRQEMGDLRRRARAWTREHGEDLPEVVEWSWAGRPAGAWLLALDHGRTGQPGRPELTVSPAGRGPAGRSRAPRRSAPRARRPGSVGADPSGTVGVVVVAVGSTSMPSAASPRSASARTRGTCSPTPPVKTTASAPPSTAR